MLFYTKLSVFGGSAWKWNSQREEFYLHQFLDKQPDLNYNNEAVRKEMEVSDYLNYSPRCGFDYF